MFVCLSVCLSVNFFSVKDFSATTWVRILKFGAKPYVNVYLNYTPGTKYIEGI